MLSDTALVSGGSRGLGLAIVSDLLSHGAHVATFSRSRSAALTQLQQQFPDHLHSGCLDAADALAIDAFIAETAARFGPLSTLISNAAVGQDRLLALTPSAEIERIVSVNLTGPLLLTRAFIRHLLACGHPGRAVLISSITATRAYPGVAAYAAAKAGLEAATRCLAREMRGRLTVNCLAPGYFESEMSSGLSDGQLSAIARRTPTRRLSTTQDVIAVMRMLLASDTNINGQTITIDGGATV